jgi:hypothetical protein
VFNTQFADPETWNLTVGLVFSLFIATCTFLLCAVVSNIQFICAFVQIHDSIFQNWMADRIDSIATTLAFHTFAFYSFLLCVALWPLTFPGNYRYFSVLPTTILIVYTWRRGPLGGKIFKEVSPLLQLWFDPKDDELRELAVRELFLLTESLVNDSGRSDEDELVESLCCTQIGPFLESINLSRYLKKFVDANIEYNMIGSMKPADFTALGTVYLFITFLSLKKHLNEQTTLTQQIIKLTVLNIYCNRSLDR